MEPGRGAPSLEKETPSEGAERDDTDNDNGLSNERGNVGQREEQGLVAHLEHEPPSEVSVVGSDDSDASQARGSRKRKEKGNSQAAGSSTKRDKRGSGKVPKTGKRYLYNILLAKICRMFWLKMFLFPVCQC